MTLRTAEEYVAGLCDKRTVYYQGQLVSDITKHPDLRVAVDHSASDFARSFQDPNAIYTGEDGIRHSAYYRIPRDADDLLARQRLIEASTADAGTLVTLVREIGTDALFALLRLLNDEMLERARAYYLFCRQHDLALAVAQTDVKGDRSLPPSGQADPDVYVRVVDENVDGIVVRGAKAHTSVSANADELIVLPTRAMGPADSDWAVAFAVPVATKGVHLFVSPYGSGAHDAFEHPLSSHHKMLESLTVFDDVFVPWERVFCYRKPELAGPIALGFVEYHRFTAVSYKFPLLDALVGAAFNLAEMNGIAGAAHVRDKLARLVAYAETVRHLGKAAANHCVVDTRNMAVPDPVLTNLAKLSFATGYHAALEIVQDLAGGLLVTGPGGQDWENPEIRPVLERYFRAHVDAEERLRMMNLVSDLSVRDFGGYHAVLAVHAEGSIEAEKLQLLRSYDPSRSVAYARRLAGIDG